MGVHRPRRYATTHPGALPAGVDYVRGIRLPVALVARVEAYAERWRMTRQGALENLLETATRPPASASVCQCDHCLSCPLVDPPDTV